eukprot:872960-Rhodomonas_salina.2
MQAMCGTERACAIMCTRVCGTERACAHACAVLRERVHALCGTERACAHACAGCETQVQEPLSESSLPVSPYQTHAMSGTDMVCYYGIP